MAQAPWEKYSFSEAPPGQDQEESLSPPTQRVVVPQEDQEEDDRPGQPSRYALRRGLGIRDAEAPEAQEEAVEAPDEPADPDAPWSKYDFSTSEKESKPDVPWEKYDFSGTETQADGAQGEEDLGSVPLDEVPPEQGARGVPPRVPASDTDREEIVITRTPLEPEDEHEFQQWFQGWASNMGMSSLDPDDIGHAYDFRGAFKAEMPPVVDQETGQLSWPAEFRDPTHPKYMEPQEQSVALGQAPPSVQQMEQEMGIEQEQPADYYMRPVEMAEQQEEFSKQKYEELEELNAKTSWAETVTAVTEIEAELGERLIGFGDDFIESYEKGEFKKSSFGKGWDNARFGLAEYYHKRQLSGGGRPLSRDTIKKLLDDGKKIEEAGKQIATAQGLVGKVFQSTMQTAAPVIASAVSGIGMKGWGPGVTWQQHGAGTIIYEYLSDKDLDKMSDKDLEVLYSAANAAGVVYSGIERMTAVIPGLKSVGGAFAKKWLVDKVADAVTKKGTVRNKIVKGGMNYIRTWVVELFEEFAQENVTKGTELKIEGDPELFRKSWEEAKKVFAPESVLSIGLVAGGGVAVSKAMGLKSPEDFDDMVTQAINEKSAEGERQYARTAALRYEAKKLADKKKSSRMRDRDFQKAVKNLDNYDIDRTDQDEQLIRDAVKSYEQEREALREEIRRRQKRAVAEGAPIEERRLPVDRKPADRIIDPTVEGEPTAPDGEAEAPPPEDADKAAQEPVTEPMPAAVEEGTRILYSNTEIEIEEPGEKVYKGRVLGTAEEGGKPVEALVNPQMPEKQTDTYVVEEVDPKTKEFKGYKIMAGYESMEAAEEAYLSQFPEGYEGLGRINEMKPRVYAALANKKVFVPPKKAVEKPQPTTTPGGDPDVRIDSDEKPQVQGTRPDGPKPAPAAVDDQGRQLKVQQQRARPDKTGPRGKRQEVKGVPQAPVGAPAVGAPTLPKIESAKDLEDVVKSEGTGRMMEYMASLDPNNRGIYELIDAATYQDLVEKKEMTQEEAEQKARDAGFEGEPLDTLVIAGSNKVVKRDRYYRDLIRVSSQIGDMGTVIEEHAEMEAKHWLDEDSQENWDKIAKLRNMYDEWRVEEAKEKAKKEGKELDEKDLPTRTAESDFEWLSTLATAYSVVRQVQRKAGISGTYNKAIKRDYEARVRWFQRIGEKLPPALESFVRKVQGRLSDLDDYLRGLISNAAELRRAIRSKKIDPELVELLDRLIMEPRKAKPERVATREFRGGDTSVYAMDFSTRKLPGQVSTRYPTAVQREADPDQELLQVGIEPFLDNATRRQSALRHFSSLENFRRKQYEGGKAYLERIVQELKENLLWLHDQYDPEIRERAKLWYEGARRIADDLAAEYDITPEQVAGIMAIYSPQTDWFVNVERGMRFIHLYKRKADEIFNDELMAQIEGFAATSPDTQALLPAIRKYLGKKMSEITNPAIRGLAIRAYDQAYGDRRPKIITPEGGVNEGDYSGAQTPWGSLNMFEKAISIIENGDLDNISRNLGGQHKVRNFYNNIIHPENDYDVTIDTHAVAAALLQPMAGNDAPVSANFGNLAGLTGVNSSKDGIYGVYGVYAEAYRRAAAERNLLAREMQSITWEAVRGLFTDGFKQNPNNKKLVKDTWKGHIKDRGYDLEETRNKISEIAGGIQPPSWRGTGRGDSVVGREWSTREQEDLPAGELPGPKRDARKPRRRRAGRSSGVLRPTPPRVEDTTFSTRQVKAVDEIRGLGWPNPITPSQVIIDNAVKVEVIPTPTDIWLKNLEAIERGLGTGTEVLSKIKDVADKHEVDIILNPVPPNEADAPRLINWYKRQGFEQREPLNDSVLIYRPPKTVALRGFSGERKTRPAAYTEISQDEYGEYRVRLFINDVYQAGADHYTDDLEEARATAEIMEAEGVESDKTTEQAILEQEEFDEDTIDGERDTLTFSTKVVKLKGFGQVPEPDSQVLDEDYFAALKWDDDEIVQAIVEEAARLGGYNSEMVYHGTKQEIKDETFDTKGDVIYGVDMGTHFTPSKPTAWVFSDQDEPDPFYLDLKNPLRLADIGMFSDVRLMGKELERLGMMSEKGWVNAVNVEQAKVVKQRKGMVQGTKNVEVIAMQNLLKNMGYDGLVYLNRNEIAVPGEGGYGAKIPANIWADSRKYMDPNKYSDAEFKRRVPDAAISYAVFDPWQIKSAKLETKDKDGNTIPLSQRFDHDANKYTFSTRRIERVPPGGMNRRDELRQSAQGRRKEQLAMYDEKIEPIRKDLHSSFQMPVPEPGTPLSEALKGMDRKFHINKVASRLVNDWQNFYRTKSLGEIENAFNLWMDEMGSAFERLYATTGIEVESGERVNALAPIERNFKNTAGRKAFADALQNAWFIHNAFLKSDHDVHFAEVLSDLPYKPSSGMARNYMNLVEIVTQEEMLDMDEDLKALLDVFTQANSGITYDELMKANAEALADMLGRSDVQDLGPGMKVLTPRQQRMLDAEHLAAHSDEDIEKARKAVDEQAQAKGFWIDMPLFHGTTHRFREFRLESANRMSDFGEAFYFTSSLDDASKNYARMGPDLQNSIGMRMDELIAMDETGEMTMEKAEEIAKQELLGPDSQILEVYVKMENPAVIDENTYLPGYDADLEQYREEAEQQVREDNDLDPEASVANYQDEVEMNMELLQQDDLDSPGWQLWSAINYVAQFYDDVGNYDEAPSYGNSSLLEIDSYLREVFAWAGDYDSGLVGAGGSALQRVYRRLGYDGIVDYSVPQKFGPRQNRPTGYRGPVGMPGVGNDTYHVIMWDPERIKSRKPFEFDENGNPVQVSQRFNTDTRDISFSTRVITPLDPNTGPYAPNFKSTIPAALDKIKSNKFQVGELLKRISETAGAKKEADWTGLTYYLDKKPKSSLASKDEILRYLELNDLAPGKVTRASSRGMDAIRADMKSLGFLQRVNGEYVPGSERVRSSVKFLHANARMMNIGTAGEPEYTHLTDLDYDTMSTQGITDKRIYPWTHFNRDDAVDFWNGIKDLALDKNIAAVVWAGTKSYYLQLIKMPQEGGNRYAITMLEADIGTLYEDAPRKVLAIVGKNKPLFDTYTSIMTLLRDPDYKEFGPVGVQDVYTLDYFKAAYTDWDIGVNYEGYALPHVALFPTYQTDKRIGVEEYAEHVYYLPDMAIESDRFKIKGFVYASHSGTLRNPVAHLRSTTLLDPDRGKVFFVEEAQSDMATYIKAVKEKGSVRKGSEGGPPFIHIGDIPGTYGRSDLFGIKLPGVAEEDIKAEMKKAFMPWEKTYPELLVREAFRMAAASGKDYVAFTNALTIANMFDPGDLVAVELDYSNNVLIVTREEDGEGGVDRYDLDKYDLEEILSPALYAQYEEHKLARDKIKGEKTDFFYFQISQWRKNYIAKPWHIGLYNRYIRNYVKKYAKKMGSKAEYENLSIGPEGEGKYLTAKVTPEMKAKALEGTPTFSTRKLVAPKADMPNEHHKFGQRVSKDESMDVQVRNAMGSHMYRARSNQDAVKDANQRMAAFDNLNEAWAEIQNLNNDIPDETRVAMAFGVMQTYVDKAEPESDQEKKTTFLDKAIDIGFWLDKYGLQGGRRVQAYSMYDRILATPQGAIRFYIKLQNNEQMKVKQLVDPVIKTTKQAIDQVNKETLSAMDIDALVNEEVNRVLKSLETAQAKRELNSYVSKQTLDENIVNSWVGQDVDMTFATRGAAPKVQTAPWMDKATNVGAKILYSEKLHNNKAGWEKRMVELGGEKVKPYLETLWLRSRQKVRSAGKAGLTKSTVDQMADRVIANTGSTLSEILKEHYSSPEAAQAGLVERLILEGGMDRIDAEQLALAMQERFTALAEKRKRDLVEEIMKKKNIPKSQRDQRAVNEIIELSNLGALSEEEYWDVISRKYELPEMNSDIAADLMMLSEKVKAAPEGTQREDALQDLMIYMSQQKGVSLRDVAWSIYYANMLSAVETNVRNLSGNLWNAIVEIPILAVTHPRDFHRIMGGYASGLYQGVVEAKWVFFHGSQAIKYYSKYENAPPSLEIIDKVLEGVSKPRTKASVKAYKTIVDPFKIGKYAQRALQAGDIVFYKPAEEAMARLSASRMAREMIKEGKTEKTFQDQYVELVAKGQTHLEQYKKQAKEEGLTGSAAKRRILELAEMNRPPETREEAAEFGARLTFNYPPEGYLGDLATSINGFLRKRPTGRAVIPFVNIIANVTNMSLDYVPPVAAARLIWGMKKDGKWTRISGDRRLSLHAKMWLGTGMLMTLAAMAGDDELDWFDITGPGPTNRDDYYQWAKNNQEYSIKIGNKFFSYKYTPMVIPFSILGHYLDAVRFDKLGDIDIQSRVMFASMKGAQVIMDQSFLSGLSDLLTLISRDYNPETVAESWGRYVSRLATTFVTPNLARKIYRYFDPNVYTAKDINTNMLREFPAAPAFKEGFYNRINVFGEDIKYKSFWEAVGFKDSKNVPYAKILVEKDAYITVPRIGSKKIYGIPLEQDPDAFVYFMRKRGSFLKEYLTKNYSRLSAMSDEEAQKEIKIVTEQATEIADVATYNYMMMER